MKLDYTYLADFKPAIDRVITRLMYGEKKHGQRFKYSEDDYLLYREKLLRHAIEFTAHQGEQSLEAIVVNALILMMMEEK